jgi:hypothetical protein
VQEAAELLNALSGTEKQAERLLFLSDKGFVFVHQSADPRDVATALVRGGFEYPFLGEA